MAKVLGFDSWTGGASKFARLCSVFERNHMELRLSHIGSWTSGRAEPPSERISGMQVRDISSYSKPTLSGILDEEAPDAVVFLSTDTFAHRAFNRYCAQRGVPTVHLFHGLVSVQATNEATQYRVNPVAQLKFILPRVPKALCRIWPTYIHSLWRSRASMRDWVRFGTDVCNLSLGRRPVVSAVDARATRSCVYVEADVDYAVARYGYRPEEVCVVGNPDLQAFKLGISSLGCCLSRSLDEHRYVMYIDTGLPFTGYVFDSMRQFTEHLVQTRDALARIGRTLIVKLHPDHSRHGTVKVLQSAGIAVCENDQFVARLLECTAAIVEPSTVAVIPALMGMPLLLARYGPLMQQSYGHVVTSYPRARSLCRLDEIDTTIADAQYGGKVDEVMSWVLRNAGPMPAEHMPERVASVVREMIDVRRGRGEIG